MKTSAEDEGYALDNALIWKLQQSLKFNVDVENKSVSFNFDFEAARESAGEIAKAAIESFLSDCTIAFSITDKGLVAEQIMGPRKVTIKPDLVRIELSAAGRDRLIAILKQIPDGPEIDEDTGEPWLEQGSFYLSGAEITPK